MISDQPPSLPFLPSQGSQDTTSAAIGWLLEKEISFFSFTSSCVCPRAESVKEEEAEERNKSRGRQPTRGEEGRTRRRSRHSPGWCTVHSLGGRAGVYCREMPRERERESRRLCSHSSFILLLLLLSLPFVSRSTMAVASTTTTTAVAAAAAAASYIYIYSNLGANVPFNVYRTCRIEFELSKRPSFLSLALPSLSLSLSLSLSPLSAFSLFNFSYSSDGLDRSNFGSESVFLSFTLTIIVIIIIIVTSFVHGAMSFFNLFLRRDDTRAAHLPFYSVCAVFLFSFSSSSSSSFLFFLLFLFTFEPTTSLLCPQWTPAALCNNHLNLRRDRRVEPRALMAIVIII